MTAPDWEMPRWLEPYRRLLTTTGGNDPADLINRLHRSRTLAQTNLPVYVMATAVSAQIALLGRLFDLGMLKTVDEPSPLLGYATTEMLLREIAARGRMENSTDGHRELGQAMAELAGNIIEELPADMLAYRTVDAT